MGWLLLSLFTPRRVVFLMAGVLCFIVSIRSTAAQTAPAPVSKANASVPVLPVPPAVDQEQFISYWTTEVGWSSEIQLRNNRSSGELVVTPVLRSGGGVETALAALSIKPQEVKSLDLNSAIAAADAPQLVGAWGSVVLRYRSPSSGSLYAAMMIHRVGHAIAIHVDATSEFEDVQSGGREGVWWLPKGTTDDLLVVSNESRNAIPFDLSLYDAAGDERKQRILLGPAETARYSVRQLLESVGLSASSYGGLKIFTDVHAGSLNSLHFVFDEAAGFSAILNMFDRNPSAKPEERDYAKTGTWTLRAPMLALSSPDPALAFPPGTVLRPQLFIRNTTPKAVDASLRFGWRSETATGKVRGPVLHLNSFETRRVDVAALQDDKTLPRAAHWASVALTSNANPDEVIAVAASYDETLRYGAQTAFKDQLSFQWEGGIWQYDAHRNSIITAGNGGSKPTRVAFRIFYNQGTQRYELEQALQPDEQMWIDVGRLVREHVPDKNGNVLPGDLTSGSYGFRDLANNGAGVLFEGKVIYDKTYGHAAYGCASCCGYAGAVVSFDPVSVGVGSTVGNGVNGLNGCTLLYEDISDSFYGTWSVADTSIATVDTYGTLTGQAAGSTTAGADAFVPNAVQPHCYPQRRRPRGTVNVTPVITGPNTVWYFNGFSPPGYAVSIQLTSNGGSGTQWNVTAGGNKINLSATTGSTTTVTSTGTAFSSVVGDITLTATANSQTSVPFAITSRTPYALVAGAINTYCDSGYGYSTYLNYTIQDQLLSSLPSGVPLNENWTTGVMNDYSGTNWRRGNAGNYTTTGSTFADWIQGENVNLPPTPTPLCNGDGTAIQHWGQEWRIGTLTIGSGKRVQTDTLQRYRAYAAHTGIVSPAP